MRRLLSTFLRVTDGNVAITFGLAVVPIIFGLGMGVDYSSAAQRRLRINAAADAAALFAVNPSELTQTEAVATAAAKAVFDAQVTSMTGVQYVPLSVNVTIPPDKVVNGNKTRTVTVSYQAKSINAFSGILGVKTILIAGTSGSSAAFAPNIDFYLMLDTSPSMAIGATTADMNKLIALTSKQGGCAFGCHESNAAKYDTGLGNPGGVDNYTLAKNNGLRLRIDVVNDAVQQMISNAKSPPNGITYRIGSYTFDYFFNQLAPPPNSFGTGPYVTTDLDQVQSLTKSLQTVTVFKPNWITPLINDGEADTNFDLAMNSINAIMPTPGNGTSLPGDTPQEVLFIVSDGVIDEPNGSVVGSRIIAPIDTPQAQSWCQTVRNRGIRIAFLYTTYIPIPTNDFYNQHVASFQSKLGPIYAKSCASDGLYKQVDSDDDITGAMQNLFNAATKTAHLTQ